MRTERAASPLVWLERLWQDVRYGCRMFAASPGFATVAVLSLAIGIGANSAIFSFADALLLRPMPVARPGEVLTVGSTETLESFGASSLVCSYRDYVDVRDRTKTFAGLAAFANLRAGVAPDVKTTPRLKLGMLASGNFFSVMGVEPTIGRGFRPEEDQVPGRDAVVVLSRRMWEQDFGADPSVLGRTVRINGIEFTIIGVAPSEFTGVDRFVRSDFFVPLMMSPRLVSDPKAASLEARDARDLNVKGRLKPGVSHAEAQAEIASIGADLERAYPETNKNRRFAVRTEFQARVAEDPPDAALAAMLTTLAFAVLAVACANVAGLLTSRAPVRSRELALRLAIGAGRGRLIRQLMTESVLLALAGGALGLGIGYAGMLLFRQIEIPTDLPISLTFQMDRRSLIFNVALALGSAILFGLLPAFQATRADLSAAMKAGDAVAPTSRRRWGRAVLVCGQVAVSVVLMVVATFMYRAFRQQLIAGPGYRTDHLLMMSFDPGLVRYTEPQTQRLFKQIAERARTATGVQSVTLTTSVPMAADSVGAETIVPEGFQFPVGKDNANVLSSRIDELYFDTMDLPLVGGRNFRETDSVGSPEVAIVNQQFAKHYWPGQDPIGKRFRFADTPNSWVQVVGMAKTSKYLFIAEPPTDFVYLPIRQKAVRRATIIARSSGDPTALVGPLREVVRGLDPNLPIYNVRTMEDMYRMRAVSIFNVLITTVGTMGLMGLCLSIVGLYGLVAYSASRRTREIGIRMAIGADRSTVLRMMLRQGVSLAAAGLAVGLVASIGAGHVLRASFFPGGNDQRDLTALLLVAPVVVAVTFVATYLPARYASRINPTQALRHE